MSELQVSKAASKTIAVTGDLLFDHSLLPDDRLTASYAKSLSSTIELQAPGGAWFLTQLIDRVATEAFPTPGLDSVQVAGPVESDCRGRQVAKAYTRWRKYRRKRSASGENPWVFRVEEFLGCQRAEMEDSGVYDPVNRQVADVLVIDDLRLGFTEAPQLWPGYLQEVHESVQVARETGEALPKLDEAVREALPQQILLKMGGPPDGSKLWKLLLEAPELRERLTVAIYADDLRERGSELCKGLSWDRTIEEIQLEFQKGPSSHDLGWCQRVCVVFEGGCAGALFHRGWLKMGPERDAASRSRQPRDRYLPPALQRFLFLPDEVEGVQDDRFDGKVFGAMSLVTAGLALHLLDEENYPAYIALGRGLAALRHNQLQGARIVTEEIEGECHGSRTTRESRSLQPDWEGLIHTVAWRKQFASDPAFAYSTSWPRGENDPVSEYGRGIRDLRPGSTCGHSDLLGDFTGPTLEYMYAVAARIVRDGPGRVLQCVPKAIYGNYFTVDRTEIERINAVRSLILTYVNNPADTRPLSIAVFGKPGAGKSFAIKQLLKSLPGRYSSPLTFNLSEFPDESTEALRELQSALHQVRDQTITGRIPLVFWDEFDAGELKWLKQFLAPMQDAEFRVGNLVHPLGKAIFVFAGGTCHSYAQFQDKANVETDNKGPDFVSRLRGHINIKGPNRDTPICPEEDCDPHEDPAHLIRRAIILRSQLQRTYPDLIDPQTGKAAVSESVVRGFLRVSQFRHGARSLESVLSMSQISGAAAFGSSQLPPEEQLLMHVTKDFLDQVRVGELTADIVEPLAEACHEAYRRMRAGLGGDRVPPYADLDDDWKEQNRAVARVVAAKLDDVGYKIRRRQLLNDPSGDPLAVLKEQVSLTGASGVERLKTVEEFLRILEHDRWLREKLMQGFEHCDRPRFEDKQQDLAEEARRKALRRNTNIRPYDALDDDFKKLDEIAPIQIVRKLWDFGYAIEKKKPDGVENGADAGTA